MLDAALDDGYFARRRRRRHGHHVSVFQEMLEAPFLAGCGDHQNLGQILGPAVTQGRHQIGDPSGKALHRAGGDPPPLGLTVGHLELIQAQRGVVKTAADFFQVSQKVIGRRQGDRTPLQSLPLAVLDMAPPTEFADDIIAIANHRDISEIEPAR